MAIKGSGLNALFLWNLGQLSAHHVRHCCHRVGFLVLDVWPRSREMRHAWRPWRDAVSRVLRETRRKGNFLNLRTRSGKVVLQLRTARGGGVAGREEVQRAAGSSWCLRCKMTGSREICSCPAHAHTRDRARAHTRFSAKNR